MTLREQVALLLFQQRLPMASGEDVGQLQRTVDVVPEAILAAAGDLLSERGLICDRFGDGGYVRRAEPLRQLLRALEASC